MATKQDRKKNWSKDEVNVLREEYTKHKAYLQASFNNQVTNEGKYKIWTNITTKVNALGHEVRTVDDTNHKWKNLVSQSKGIFHEHKIHRNGTGGGPPMKEPTEETQKIIDLLKDDTSFRGLTGVDTLVPPITTDDDKHLK